MENTEGFAFCSFQGPSILTNQCTKSVYVGVAFPEHFQWLTWFSEQLRIIRLRISKLSEWDKEWDKIYKDGTL